MDPLLYRQLLLVFSGVGIAFLCSFAGIGVGVWLTRKKESTVTAREVRADHVLELMGQFSNWTHGFAGEVTEYGEQVKRLLAQMSEDPAIQASSAQSAIVNQLIDANEQLRKRLEEAEESLTDKTKEVESYLSQARTDQLTELPNRRAFDDELARHFAQWQRYSTPLCLIIIDIDRFKTFNDTYGHLVGDAVLVGVAKRLSQFKRSSDFLVRFGGEEFAVILPCALISEAARAAERLGTALAAEPLEHEGQKHPVTISCGVAQAVGGDSVSSLMRRADEALYAAKENGRNRSYFHDGVRPCPVSEQDAELADEVRGGIPARFNDVCDQLRNRLIEVTKE